MRERERGLQERVPDLGDPGAPVALPDAAKLLLRLYHVSSLQSAAEREILWQGRGRAGAEGRECAAGSE
jgi:hypothetical protein